MRDVFERCEKRELEDKQHAVEVAFKNAWVNALVPVHTFISSSADAADLKSAQLVVREGPFNVLVLDMLGSAQSEFTLAHGFASRPRSLFFDDLESVLIGKAVPQTSIALDSNMGLAWKLEGNFIALKDWLCDYCMTTIKAGLLIKVCSKLKVPKHSSLDHRHRVELFLRFMGRSEEFIQEILNEIPVREKKPKKEDRLTNSTHGVA